MPNTQSRSARIAELNDAFRRTFQGGTVHITRGIRTLVDPVQWSVMAKVQAFNAFTEANDPYGEHDFGSFDHPLPDGSTLRVLWKIEYYRPDLCGGSEDPADPAKTARILTVLLAEEW